MKPLAIWIVVVLVAFTALAFLANATRGTTSVFVVVDSSFPMTTVWADVHHARRNIDDRSHSEFALATEKDFVPELRLGGVTPFAPRTFAGIEANRPS